MDGMVVEVRYQGILVGRAAPARELSVTGAFVETDAPMPVGSVVTIAPDGGPAMRARVVRVVEVGAEHGMALCWAGLGEEAQRYLAGALGAAPTDLEAGAAPAAAARGVPTAATDDGATERTTPDTRTTPTDLRSSPGAVVDEVPPGDEISAPIDVAGAPGEEPGGKGKRGRRKKR
jgi:hypothetical protein